MPPARLSLALSLVAAAGCAHTDAGWTREAGRVCPEADQWRVCVQAIPDRGVVARVGDAELVPGECAQQPAPKRRTRVHVVVEDESGGRTSESLRVRREAVSTLVIEPEGTQVQRRACEVGEPLAPAPTP